MEYLLIPHELDTCAVFCGSLALDVCAFASQNRSPKPIHSCGHRVLCTACAFDTGETDSTADKAFTTAEVQAGAVEWTVSEKEGSGGTPSRARLLSSIGSCQTELLAASTTPLLHPMLSAFDQDARNASFNPLAGPAAAGWMHRRLLHTLAQDHTSIGEIASAAAIRLLEVNDMETGDRVSYGQVVSSSTQSTEEGLNYRSRLKNPTPKISKCLLCDKHVTKVIRTREVG